MKWRRWEHPQTGIRSFFRSLGITVGVLLAATLLATALVHMSGSTNNVIMAYMVAVVCISRFTNGYLWGVAASFCGVIGVNFYFTYPYFAFDFTRYGYPITFLFMLVLSIFTSTMTIRIREQARHASDRENTTRLLYEFVQALLMIRGEDQIIRTSLERLKDVSGCDTVFWEVSAFRALSPEDRENYFCLPVSAHNSLLGAIGFFTEDPESFPDKEAEFLRLMISQTALALERQRAENRQREMFSEKEKEQMRSNLLRAISHDLRTPLTGILGASAAILENEGKIDPASQNKLISDIHEDAGWLIRMVENLLSVTRISDGAPNLQKNPEAVEEVAAEAVSRIRKKYPAAHIRVRAPEEFLMIPMDAMLIEQVLMNLIENSIKHSGSSGPVDLNIALREKEVEFQVRDYGKGIPEEDISGLFGGFAAKKMENSDSSRGIGIGLSICRSIVLAHDGRIEGKNHPDGGAVFTFYLPV